MTAKAEPLAESPYLTATECAAYLRFPSVKAFYNFLLTPDGSRLPKLRRGARVFLFDRRVVDAYLRGELSPRRGAKPVSFVHAISLQGDRDAR